MKPIVKPSVKHIVHSICMLCWIVIFIRTASNESSDDPDPWETYGVLVTVICILLRLLTLLAFPQTFLNFISLLIYDTFKGKVQLKVAPQSAPFFAVRVVTRGLYPNLVEKTVRQNEETFLQVGCEDFAIEVVTDVPLNLPIYENSHRIREIVVPKDYQTSTGALNKSRALQYCWEDTINLIDDKEWILHLDEETLVTSESVKGFLNFIHEDKYSIGQGMITYAVKQATHKDLWSNVQTRICTVADSFRVAEDLGKIRGQFNLFSKGIFGMKGSYVVTKAACERLVNFDNGYNGSLAEDAYFALKAIDQGYTFGFIEGEMWEKSPFSFNDFIKQRQRWMRGIYLTAFDSKLSLKSRLLMMASIIAWLTVPLTTCNAILVKLFPMKLWFVIDWMITFTGAMALYFYALGYVLQHRFVRRNFWRKILMVPEILVASTASIICENIAVVTLWFGSWSHFYIVQKETEEEQSDLKSIKIEQI